MSAHFIEQAGSFVLRCDRCGLSLVEVESGDSLGVIADTASDHSAFSCKGEA